MKVCSCFLVATLLVIAGASMASAQLLFDKGQLEARVKGGRSMTTVFSRLREDLRFTIGPVAGLQGGGAGGGPPTIECGASVDGELTADDPTVDVGIGGAGHFDVIVLNVTETVGATITMASGAGADPDTVLLIGNILDDGGIFLFAANDDCAPQNYDLSCITADLPPGAYALVATSFGAGETGAYTVEVTCGDPFCAVECNSGSISCGETISGEAVPESCQVGANQFLQTYALDLAQESPVTVTLQSEPGASPDTLLILANENCAILDLNDDCEPGNGDLSCLTVTLPAGRYYLGVSNNNVAGSEFGPYTLSVDCGGEAVPATSPWGGLALALGLLAAVSLVFARRRKLATVD